MMQPAPSLSRWRLLLAPPRSGAENMARDTALLARAARTGETVFSIYSWATPTLSFGRHQTAAGHYDPGKIREASVDVVRRPTGGRAILHHREITYSVTAPFSPLPLQTTYARINRILVAGLSRLGVTADIAKPAERPPAPGAGPCFDRPGKGEIVADGKKLIGSAQWRNEGALLQHGSILVEDDQTSLTKFSVAGEASNDVPVPATLGALLGRAPGDEEVADAMFEAVRQLEDPESMRIEEKDIREETLRYVEQFADERWTWRR
jgi:lipoyl(octanoyl) transferase